MKCIACQSDMASRCACGAVWLSEDKLVEMAQDMKGSLVALPWQAREGAPRGCPQCSAAMLTVSLDGVELDRCAAHGIWFDAEELQKVLQRASTFPDPKLIKDWKEHIRKTNTDASMVGGGYAPGPVEDTVNSIFLGIGTVLDLL